MKRILALLMATVMICMAFAGCGNKADDKKADPTVITKDVYVGGLIYTESMIQQNAGFALGDYLDVEIGEGMTGADLIKDNADDLFHEFECVKLIAEEKGIKVTDEDRKQLDENKKQMLEYIGGAENFEAQMGMNEAFYDYLAYGQMIYSKVTDSLFFGEGEYALSTEDIISRAEAGGYVRVKHVLVQTKEGDEDYETKKALAEDIAKKASAGENFESLIEQYGEDPGMETYTHGYIIDKNGYTPAGNAMVKEFTDGSVALAVDAISGIVKTDYGFHIIKRYPIDEASVNESFELFEQEFVQLRITEVFNEYIGKVEPKYPEGYENIDLSEIFVANEASPEAEVVPESGIESEVPVDDQAAA